MKDTIERRLFEKKMAEGVNACANCVHYADGVQAPACTNEKAFHFIHRISGEPYYYMCKVARDRSSLCGFEGKWFEEKPEEPVKPTLAGRILHYFE